MGKKRKKKEYSPRVGSCGWAILMAFQREVNQKFLRKQEVIEKAQIFTDTSFTESKNVTGAGFGYNGWSSMGTLQKKGLIQTTKSKFSLYGLTEKGRKLADKIYEEDCN